MTEKAPIRGQSPKGIKDEQLDKVKGGAGGTLVKSSLDQQGATRIRIHGSDFNAAKSDEPQE